MSVKLCRTSSYLRFFDTAFSTGFIHYLDSLVGLALLSGREFLVASMLHEL